MSGGPARASARPTLLTDLLPLSSEVAASMERGEALPWRALDQMMNRAAARRGSGISGWLLEASDLKDLPFPEALLRRPNISLAVSVSPYRPQGEAWARYAVLVILEDAQNTTAGLEAPSPSVGQSHWATTIESRGRRTVAVRPGARGQRTQPARTAMSSD